MSGFKVSKLHTFLGHKDAVYTLEPLDEQLTFFSGSGDGMVVKWDFNEPDQGHLVANMQNSVYALQSIPEKNLLVVGHNFEGIHVINLNQNKEVGSLVLDQSAIFDIKYLNGVLLVSCGSGIVYVVDLEKLRIVKLLQHSEKSARCISVNSTIGEFAVGYSDNTIRIFDVNNFQVHHQLLGHTNSVFTLAYHPKRPLLVSGSRDAHLKIWDLNENYKLTKSIAAHMYAINHIEFSPNGLHFVTCSMDKSIKVWDAHQIKLLKVIDKTRYASHGTSVNKLYWSRYNNQLVSCSDDRTITVWDLNI
jgi:WD40 repeat protein